MYQRGSDGYPIGSDNIMREKWGPIPDPNQPFWSKVNLCFRSIVRSFDSGFQRSEAKDDGTVYGLCFFEVVLTRHYFFGFRWYAEVT